MLIKNSQTETNASRKQYNVNSNVNMATLLDSYEQQYGIITAGITAKTAKLSAATLGK